MRPSQFQRRSSRLFVGPKCSRAIPVKSPLVRDYLIQATLDPLVSVLDFVSHCQVGRHNVRLDEVTVMRDGTCFIVDLGDELKPRGVDEEGARLLCAEALGLSVMTTTAAEVRSQPRLGTCREIWSHRTTRVPFDEREEILGTIEDAGALTLKELMRRVMSGERAMAAVCALACDGSLVVDTASPLGDASTIWIGGTGRHRASLPYVGGGLK